MPRMPAVTPSPGWGDPADSGNPTGPTGERLWVTTERGDPMSGRRSMGAVDAIWLSMDSPENLMVIEGIMTLEGPIDWERLTAVLQHRLVDRYPVFRQVVVEATSPMGMPHWEDDPDFSIDHHLHHATLPEPGDEAALQAFVERKMQEPHRPQPTAVALLRHRRLPRRLGRRLALPPRPRRRHRPGRGAAVAHRRGAGRRPAPRRAAPRRHRRRAGAAAHQPAGGRRPVRPPVHRPGVGRPARCAERAQRDPLGAAPVVSPSRRSPPPGRPARSPTSCCSATTPTHP